MYHLLKISAKITLIIQFQYKKIKLSGIFFKSTESYYKSTGNRERRAGTGAGAETGDGCVFMAKESKKCRA